MNVFILDADLDKCARAHVSKHQKMILELSQLLCTSLHLNPGLKVLLNISGEIPYKKTHFNHPCAVFARKSKENYTYVAGLLYALGTEFQKRTGKLHMSFVKLLEAGLVNYSMYANAKELNIETMNAPKCMPDEYKVDSVIESYRNYYRYGKIHLHCWKNSAIPEWL